MRSFPLGPREAELCDRLGQEFLADFFSRATARHPENLPALVDLASALTRLGRYEEGLAVDLKLQRLAPDNPTVLYNLACSYALLRRSTLALDALERAIEVGFDDPEHLLADEDLECLREDRRFRELVLRLSGPASEPTPG